MDLPGLDVRLGKDGSFVEGLSEWDVADEEEVLALIEKGQGLKWRVTTSANTVAAYLAIIVKVCHENFITGP